jgi:hypothetical protein
MVVRDMFFFQQNETIKHLFFQYHLPRSIWLVIQLGSTLYLLGSVDNIFENWLHNIVHRFRMHIRVGVIGRYG